MNTDQNGERKLHYNDPRREMARGKVSSKIEQARAAGFRILPVPRFFPAGFCYDPKRNIKSAFFISFSTADTWLVIPPDTIDLPGQKFEGRNRAVNWAVEQAALLLESKGCVPDGRLRIMD